MKITSLIFFCLLLGTTTVAQSIKPAPEIDLRDMQGHDVKLADYKGQVLLVNFYVTC